MFKFVFIFIIIIIIYLFVTYKIKIKWNTFLHRGFKPNRGIFGIYCYCGKQGSGKTYSVVEYLNANKDKVIYANLRSLKGIQYTYINGFKELLKLRGEHDIIIFYDEIFTELTKFSKINTDVLDFLSQMRKRRIIFLTTAQEWAEIPLTFRRYCRYQINCKLVRLPIIKGILIKNFMDAENMKWSNDDNDFIAPLIENTVSHLQIRIANTYDTFEQIGKFSHSTPSGEVLETSLDEESNSPEGEIGGEEKEIKLDFNFWNDVKDDEVMEDEQ